MSQIALDRTEDEVFNDEISDEALEAAGMGSEQASPNTHPFAIICIPFAPQDAQRGGVVKARSARR